jgi:hypothetical protein
MTVFVFREAQIGGILLNFVCPPQVFRGILRMESIVSERPLFPIIKIPVFPWSIER